MSRKVGRRDFRRPILDTEKVDWDLAGNVRTCGARADQLRDASRGGYGDRLCRAFRVHHTNRLLAETLCDKVWENCTVYAVLYFIYAVLLIMALFACSTQLFMLPMSKLLHTLMSAKC